MDFIDNLMYANLFSFLQTPLSPGGNRIQSEYIGQIVIPPPPNDPFNVGSVAAPIYTYDVADKMNFCSFEDPSVIETTLLRHWYDINNLSTYDSGGVNLGGINYSSFANSSTYHMMYAYLLESTRMLQIFERMIEKYLYDEEFGIANNAQAFNWIQNTERLFFKNDTPRSSYIRSLIKPNSEYSRRNAYWRMLSLNLPFGDTNSSVNDSINYHKAASSNKQFIVLFEKFLVEIWRNYTNANNTSYVNLSDVDVIVDLATQLRELLIARRGDVDANTYANLNLSREEYSSVFMTSWFTFIISDNTPVVEFLNCQSSEIGERLLNIGVKVGIPAHRKCQSFFEMAGSVQNILCVIEEGGVFDNSGIISNILISLIPPVAANYTIDMKYMNALLTIINNWEKATGHRLKNPESYIRSGFLGACI